MSGPTLAQTARDSPPGGAAAGTKMAVLVRYGNGGNACLPNSPVYKPSSFASRESTTAGSVSSLSRIGTNSTGSLGTTGSAALFNSRLGLSELSGTVGSRDGSGARLLMNFPSPESPPPPQAVGSGSQVRVSGRPWIPAPMHHQCQSHHNIVLPPVQLICLQQSRICAHGTPTECAVGDIGHTGYRTNDIANGRRTHTTPRNPPSLTPVSKEVDERYMSPDRIHQVTSSFTKPGNASVGRVLPVHTRRVQEAQLAAVRAYPPVAAAELSRGHQSERLARVTRTPNSPVKELAHPLQRAAAEGTISRTRKTRVEPKCGDARTSHRSGRDSATRSVLESMDTYLLDLIHDVPEIFVIEPRQSVFHEWEVVALLGSGTFAAVYEVKHLRTGEKAAAKLLAPQKFRTSTQKRVVEMFAKEIRYSVCCRCPSVVNVKHVIRGMEGWLIIQDMIQGGTLWEQRQCKSSTEAFSLFVQLFQAVLHMQDKGVVHRDLKPTNILRSPNGTRVWITDFGWCEGYRDLNTHVHELPGTIEINPPEVLSHEKCQTEKIDNYALGMNLMLLLTSQFVCRSKGLPTNEAARRILDNIAMIRKSDPLPGFTADGWEVFLGLSEFDPSKRASLEEVLGSPWFATGIADLWKECEKQGDPRILLKDILWHPAIFKVIESVLHTSIESNPMSLFDEDELSEAASSLQRRARTRLTGLSRTAVGAQTQPWRERNSGSHGSNPHGGHGHLPRAVSTIPSENDYYTNMSESSPRYSKPAEDDTITLTDLSGSLKSCGSTGRSEEFSNPAIEAVEPVTPVRAVRSCSSRLRSLSMDFGESAQLFPHEGWGLLEGAGPETPEKQKSQKTLYTFEPRAMLGRSDPRIIFPIYENWGSNRRSHGLSRLERSSKETTSLLHNAHEGVPTEAARLVSSRVGSGWGSEAGTGCSGSLKSSAVQGTQLSAETADETTTGTSSGHRTFPDEISDVYGTANPLDPSYGFGATNPLAPSSGNSPHTVAVDAVAKQGGNPLRRMRIPADDELCSRAGQHISRCDRPPCECSNPNWPAGAAWGSPLESLRSSREVWSVLPRGPQG